MKTLCHRIMQYAILLLVFSLVELLGCHCKDMEDDRGLYHNPNVLIVFKGSKPLKIKYAETESKKQGKKNILEHDGIKNDTEKKKTIRDNLTNLKDKRLFVPLSDNDSSITLRLFYDDNTSTNTWHEITIDYHKADVLVSPHCGIQTVYIIDHLKTSFPEYTILIPDGKVMNCKNPHVEIKY